MKLFSSLFSNKKVLILLIVLLSVGVGYSVGELPDTNFFHKDKMILYYHFNNQSAYGENDTYVYDFSGNNNNGTNGSNPVFNTTGGIIG